MTDEVNHLWNRDSPLERCPRSFFAREPDLVARDLIGAIMMLHRGTTWLRVRIVETEAYGGFDDPASHAYRGVTPRCAVMFGPPGHFYVYRSYGIHWCVNVVTGVDGAASAVLLRAGEIVGIIDNEDRVVRSVTQLLRGPGNLTKGLGITGSDNGADCCAMPGGEVHFEMPVGAPSDDVVSCTPRIGVSQGRERLSRYALQGHRAVSSPRRSTSHR